MRNDITECMSSLLSSPLHSELTNAPVHTDLKLLSPTLISEAQPAEGSRSSTGRFDRRRRKGYPSLRERLEMRSAVVQPEPGGSGG